MAEQRGAQSSDLDLATLEAFIAIAEAGSFRAAAAMLYTSQSSLSRVIARLEQDLGVTLFERSPSGVVLSVPGQRLLVGARRLLQAASDVLDSISNDQATTLRLGASATAAGSFLAEFLSHWIPRNKNVALEILEGGAASLGSQLSRRDCDVAIVATPAPTSCESIPLTTCTVMAIFPPDHPLANESGPLSITALKDESLLANGRDFLSTRVLLAACREAVISPSIIYQSRVGQTLAALVEAGLGVAVLSDNVDLRGFQLPRRVLVDIGGRPLSFDLSVAWWDRAKASPARRFAHDLAEFHTAGLIRPS